MLIIIVDAPGAGPILASHMGVDWIDSPNIMGRQEDVVNRSDVVRLTSIIDTGGQKDFVFIPNCYAFVGNAKALVVGDFKNWPVLPANGGTKKVKFTVNDTSVNVKTTNSANTVGVTMALTALNEGTISAPDPNGYITLQAGKEYEMTLTSAQKAAGDNWVVENINVEFNDGANAPENYKFTVFWVIMTAKADGKIDDQDGIPANAKDRNGKTIRSFYQEYLRYDPHDEKDLGHKELGFNCFNDNMVYGGIYFRGVIVPSGLDHSLFKSDGFRYTRGKTWRVWNQDDKLISYDDQVYPNVTFVAAQDAGDDGETLREATDKFTENAFQAGMDATPDNDTGGELMIHWVDAPFAKRVHFEHEDRISRWRVNFTEAVAYYGPPQPDGTPILQRCSDDVAWSLSFSVKSKANNKLELLTTHGEVNLEPLGENQIKINSAIQLTPALDAPPQNNSNIAPNQNFAFTPHEDQVNFKDYYWLEIKGDNLWGNGPPVVYLYEEVAPGQYRAIESHRIHTAQLQQPAGIKVLFYMKDCPAGTPYKLFVFVDTRFASANVTFTPPPQP